MDSIIDKTAIMNVIKQYTGVDDADEARNKLLSRGLFSKAKKSAEETRGQVASAVSNTVEDALASVAGLTNLTISKRSVAEDPETPDLPEDQPGELFDDPAMRTFETDLYVAREEKPTDAKVIGDSIDDDGGTSIGKVPTIAAIKKGEAIVEKEIGIKGTDWNTYKKEIAKIESKGSGNYLAVGGYNDHYDGRYQLGEDAKIDAAAYLDTTINHTQEDRESFRNDASLQEKAFAAYTAKNHSYLMDKKLGSKKYRSLSTKEKMVVLAYAHNQGYVGAKTWLERGRVGADGLGTKGTKYSDALESKLKIKLEIPEFVSGAPTESIRPKARP